MNQKFYLSSLAIYLTMAISPTFAAEPISLQTTSLNDLRQEFQIQLPGVKKAATTPADDTLQLVSQHTDVKKITHMRMQQYYAGFFVFGGYAIMHSTQPAKGLLSANNQVKMNGLLYRGIKADLGKPSPTFIAGSKNALQRFKSQFQNGSISDEQVKPIVYIDANQQAFWAYKVSILVSHSNSIPDRPTAILDAKTLSPLLQWNDLKTLNSAVNGMGFGGNKRMGKYQFGKEFPMLALSRDDSSATCYMENADVKVVDMEHQYQEGPNDPMHFNCIQDNSLAPNSYWTGQRSDGYDKQNGAYSPSNDAMYVGDVIHRMYSEWYNLNALTEDNKSMQLVMRVHYGEGYENAFWDSKQMTFGDGDEMLYPLVSLGIGAHEISHGFTEQHSNLNYYGQSGGINESFSDMAAQVAEYYSRGKSSWTIGAEILKEQSGYTAIRFMEKPSRDGYSIDKASEYYDDLDVHYASGVYNRLFYLMANKSGWNSRKAFQVMIKANMDYWTPYTTFEDGACGILNATKDLDYSINDVKQSLKKVAINYHSCK